MKDQSENVLSAVNNVNASIERRRIVLIVCMVKMELTFTCVLFGIML